MESPAWCCSQFIRRQTPDARARPDEGDGASERWLQYHRCNHDGEKNEVDQLRVPESARRGDDSGTAPAGSRGEPHHFVAALPNQEPANKSVHQHATVAEPDPECPEPEVTDSDHCQPRQKNESGRCSNDDPAVADRLAKKPSEQRS